MEHAVLNVHCKVQEKIKVTAYKGITEKLVLQGSKDIGAIIGKKDMVQRKKGRGENS